MYMDIDNNITKIIISNTDLFRYIHPNIITTIGLICNYFILINIDSITYKSINPYTFGLLIFIRWLSDCLDGAVARKYNKTSKLGNMLDTISDMLFMSIIFYYFMIIYDLSNYYIIIFLVAMYILFIKYDMINGHDNLKKNNENIIEKFIKFMTNNSIIVFVAFYIFVVKTQNRLAI